MIGDVADQLTHSPELADLRKQLIRNAVTLQQELLDEERDAARVSLRTARAYDRLAALQGDVGQTEDALASCEQALSVLQQLPPADLHQCGILQEDVLLRKAGFLKRLGHEDKALEIISGVQNNLSGNYEASAVVLRRSHVQRRHTASAPADNWPMRPKHYVVDWSSSDKFHCRARS